MKWYAPVQLGPTGEGLRLRTRTWVPAMVPWRATPDGEVTPAVLAWYRRFAQGRPGAIVVEATGIRDVPSGPLLRIGHDRFVDGLRRLAHAVREGSDGETRLFIQLIDFLAVKRRPPPEKFFQRFLRVDDSLRARLPGALRQLDEPALRTALQSASAHDLHEWLDPRQFESLHYGHRERVTDTHLDHIRELPKTLPPLFADAAVRAREAGFDGVELHYAHAYTMASFLSARNDRTDGYGGSREGRVRLPLEVYERVRAAVGPDYCVGARFLGDEVIEGGGRVGDSVDYAVRFARAGFDFLSVSKGGKFEDAKAPRVGQAVYPYTGPSGHECMPTVKIDDAKPEPKRIGPFSRNVPLARAVRAAVRADGWQTPVVTAGGISSPWQAEEILEAGDADIVAAARQSLADPDWFRKIELGRGAEVRRCLFTNYCEGLDQKHAAVTCQLWDRMPGPDPEGLRSEDGRRRLVAPAWDG